MKQLILTGLGNEVDLGTGKIVCMAVFNGKVRIEISQEAMKTLTDHAYSAPAVEERAEEEPVPSFADTPKPSRGGYSFESEAQKFGGEEEEETPPMVITDNPGSVFEEDTGVEQV